MILQIHQQMENQVLTAQQYSTAPEQSNAGTLMLDATCAPQQIAYPQDFQLLNDARKA